MPSLSHRLAALVLLLLVAAEGSHAAKPSAQAGTPIARGLGAPTGGGSGRRLLAGTSEATAAAGGTGPAANITATYRGDWAKLAWPPQLLSGLLRQSGGVAVLKLRTLGDPQVCELPCRPGGLVGASRPPGLQASAVHVPACTQPADHPRPALPCPALPFPPVCLPAVERRDDCAWRFGFERRPVRQHRRHRLQFAGGWGGGGRGARSRLPWGWGWGWEFQ
jgi:hypothetical protein